MGNFPRRLFYSSITSLIFFSWDINVFSLHEKKKRKYFYSFQLASTYKLCVGWKWKAYGNDDNDDAGTHSKLISFIRDDWSTRISFILFDGTVHKPFFAFYYVSVFFLSSYSILSSRYLLIIMLFNIGKIIVKSTTGKFVLLLKHMWHVYVCVCVNDTIFVCITIKQSVQDFVFWFLVRV